MPERPVLTVSSALNQKSSLSGAKCSVCGPHSCLLIQLQENRSSPPASSHCDLILGTQAPAQKNLSQGLSVPFGLAVGLGSEAGSSHRSHFHYSAKITTHRFIASSAINGPEKTAWQVPGLKPRVLRKGTVLHTLFLRAGAPQATRRCLQGLGRKAGRGSKGS